MENWHYTSNATQTTGAEVSSSHSHAFCCFQNQDDVNLKFSFSRCQVAPGLGFSFFFFLPECALNISPLRTSAACGLGIHLGLKTTFTWSHLCLGTLWPDLGQNCLEGISKARPAGPTAASLLLHALLQKQPIRCFYFENMWQCLHFLSTGTAAPLAFRSLCNDLRDLLTRIIYQQNKIISEFVGHQILHRIQSVLILYYIIPMISPNIMLLFYNSCTCSVHVHSLFSILSGSQLILFLTWSVLVMIVSRHPLN